MKVLFKLPPSLRSELKKPVGELIEGDIPTPYLKVKDILTNEDPLVTVGDVVTENIMKVGLNPNLAIYDHKTERREYKPNIRSVEGVLITVKNPPGTITLPLLKAIKKAYSLLSHGKRVHIVVDGEEDLATIPAVLYAPIGTTVIYGQPKKGIVLIKVTNECKRRCAKIMRRMEVVRNGD
ncbi:GTP-dependent dephospho-CoA kinase [Pyrococcus abyssi]|uniref:GTP-dependent dephospho-CoA kinase n=1 Tax=Pyrococcus abyssi (strain GE5 / Orsay) TaxID=272844 RepID=DPCKG_PYRAB|nr:GTP-dependent dephospho-CoA kinase [Pyrococcus abyssi]Q9UY21.1 RecName: Full=GTP-dependent dephospho-CoA kinase; AltName: Full=Dephospho-coenzyme A kinase; Short=DPCK [Pyrococcus abyssi GE5]CAB50591.1 Hypothetical protein PAB1106 [Pyrococcus abyssi GE5]CCE71155.1 TPA: hypothetical protein PAB1106 [Pyrococcus abyssi GE5]